jgi:hypothetical protein
VRSMSNLIVPISAATTSTASIAIIKRSSRVTFPFELSPEAYPGDADGGQG